MVNRRDLLVGAGVAAAAADVAAAQSANARRRAEARPWAQADELPRLAPSHLGFGPDRLSYIDKFYSDKVNASEMAGIVILIARHGKIAHLSALGFSQLDKKRRMEPNTIFRLYSMTKPVTSTALMMLYEQGRFQMNDALSRYIPEFSNLKVLRTPDSTPTDITQVAHPPTVEDVLRHTAGFTHGLGTPKPVL